jgi:hypothetical protein
MKINRIRAEGFQGARHVDVQLSHPVTMFAGHNGAGKSSLKEAVRMALTGECVRVDMKKNYGSLVSDGADGALVEVETDIGNYAIILPKGSGTHSQHPALPYLLDSQRFAHLNDKERRTFLFGLMRVQAGRDGVCARLLALGAVKAHVDHIAPHLLGGFEAAHGGKHFARACPKDRCGWPFHHPCRVPEHHHARLHQLLIGFRV